MTAQHVILALGIGLGVGFVVGTVAWDIIVADRLRRDLDTEVIRRVRAQVMYGRVAGERRHFGTPYRPETVLHAVESNVDMDAVRALEDYGKPGVRLVGGGEHRYSADWLNDGGAA